MFFIILTDKASQKKLATDAMYKLEHGADDKEKIKKAVPGLHDLSDRQSMWKEDYMINKALRKQFRVRIYSQTPFERPP